MKGVIYSTLKSISSKELCTAPIILFDLWLISKQNVAFLPLTFNCLLHSIQFVVIENRPFTCNYLNVPICYPIE